MKSVRIISVLALITLLSMFGVAFTAGGMDHAEMMNPCPYAQGMQSVCPMTSAHHAEMWLSLFLATPETRISLLILTLAVLAVLRVRNHELIGSSPPSQNRLSQSTGQAQPEQFFYSYIIKFFRLGILHPKVF